MPELDQHRPGAPASAAAPSVPAAPAAPAAPADHGAAPARLRSLASRLLGRGATHADRISQAHFSTVGANRWQYATLVTLRDRGPASQAALSASTGIHRSDMVAVLASLAEAGHVERAPDPDDRRRNIVTLTPAGRTWLTDLEELVDQAQDELLSPLDPSERAELVRLLRRLDDHHDTR